MKSKLTAIENLLTKNHFPNVSHIQPLPSSGSNRQYFRVEFVDHSMRTILAAFNPDVNENIAWNSFTKHFRSLGMNVPEILARDDTYQFFLVEDLGNTSLFYYVSQGVNDEIKKRYEQSLLDLIRFQVEGIKGLDLDVAYPASTFDKRSVMWDLNYFKYYFLKANDIVFNEAALEDDFENFSEYLLSADCNYFMYRDFQSRNIMIFQDEPWYIDFQGGRKGPLQYDLVSLLFQARANLGDEFRSQLKSFYLTELKKVIPGVTTGFNKYYNAFIYFRLMQVLGAYGFRGKLQRKTHFLKSTNLAITNLSNLIQQTEPGIWLPELMSVYEQIIGLLPHKPTELKKSTLTVNINSFSFIQSGIPEDPSQNGGGFVFDCRALPNPGRIKELREYSGLQEPVISYLESKKELHRFLENVYGMVDQSISNYLERGFENLQINFGCTGGKHRSVYCAERLASYLLKHQDKIEIRLNHLMRKEW